ncbi:uncharacterized protein LOC133298669 [Gastrolobium bilobum]|uniref:uncharacterized protein LOC133298669 n=1 Tax=Gastrolobium bilobum TaxID=150636 RepID=UPI002AB1D76A|nr:uncharacterized protein LOC133298669 [Gastrolobium bilobum]
MNKVAQLSRGNNMCPICNSEPETMLRALRDCLETKQFWISPCGQWRNEKMHGTGIPPFRSREVLIQKLVHDVEMAVGRGNEHLVVNTDGAARGAPSIAACDEVMRDSQGRWLGGFAYRLWICNSFRAELWGVLRGLELVWNSGHRNVII